MANFYLWATFGLCLLKLCLTETQFNVSCRYGGVFHVEKNGRYSLTRTEAIELCRALNSTLATLEQFERAHRLGFETCRYGFIVGHIVIPRINPYHLCAANYTGIYKLSANTTGRYDAYCYNATESRNKTCEPVERIDTSFLSNQSEIVIDNEDGSRYNTDGTRHSGDSSTSGVDDENLGSGSIHDTTPGDTSIRRSSPSYYGSVTPISHMPDHSSGGGEKDLHVKEYGYESSPTSTVILATATDFPTEDDVQHPASTTLATPDGAPHEDPIQPTLPSENEAAWSTESITHSTDAPGGPVLLGLDPTSTDEAGEESLLLNTITVSTDVFHPEEATSRPLAPSTQPGSESGQANATDGSHVSLIPGVFPDIDDHLYQLPTPPSPRSTSSIDSDQGPYKGDSEPTPFPGESTTTTVRSQPSSARIPEWLIIVAALLALALILAVCIAVNSRRRCGQKKKLVINNGKGAVEDRKTRELNGDASKSQEMVHLVHKEQSNDQTGACDEFLTVDETQNHEDDMKSGV